MKIDLKKSVSPFSKKEKYSRFIWNIVWYLVSPLPRPASSLRIKLLRLFGSKIGKDCLIEPGVKIWIPWNLILDDFVAIGRQTEIYNYGVVSIGSMTVISQYSYLCTGSHNYSHPYMPLIWDNIVIGSECWIAAGTWIMPGVKIGDGAVIGARSLVTRDIPDWSVCAGHPCKPLKERKILNIDIID
ncbi:putative colanic acid biosynthesis acetyltransferase [Fibrella forsythiae]|uniref:Colanic acid biosynthesis acetyltransferase n=1 Tax=Fibrella forsythiae TaxID=2817061 RepID=A0ABS3JCQ0_9BACT|nr:putative colanic acid biosynthesis acetyltransferase [Fibrella forsythiae]MBO0947779.1 putative colanic acid biosynthesis acetyltransferase [Fibrella forsythiae]